MKANFAQVPFLLRHYLPTNVILLSSKKVDSKNASKLVFNAANGPILWTNYRTNIPKMQHRLAYKISNILRE